MELMERNSTDKRLDDLNEKVDRGFERVDTDIRALRAETGSEFAAVRAEMKGESAALRAEIKEGFDSMNARFDAVNGRFDAVDERFEAVNDRFEAMHRLMIQVGSVLTAALIGLIATQL